MSFNFFLSELKKLLFTDAKIVRKIALFTLVLGVFELTVPLAVQVVINRIHKTYMFEQLAAILSMTILCLVLLSYLLYIRFNLVEAIQRATFVKVSTNILKYLKDKDDLSYSLKFFEVVSMKKFFAKFLTDGLSLALSLLFGFIIIIFYHPFFAALGFLIILCYGLLLSYYHSRTAGTSVGESDAKYEIAKKINNYAINKEETSLGDTVNQWLLKRDVHFQYLKKHYLVILVLFIFSHLILLGVGGSLVLTGELTIGQLVASELIFSTILAGVSKSIVYIEMYYDTFAGLKKLSFIKEYNSCDKSSLNIPHYERSARSLKYLSIVFPILLVLLPWVQTSESMGTYTTLRPEERVQDISALVKGRIARWYVTEGQFVEQGAPIVEIVDNDPNYSERLKMDRDAAYKKYEAARMAAETALLDFERQESLFESGLTSRLKFEKAKIDYHKLIASEAEAASSLAKKEVSFARQQRQIITAPSDGVVQQLLSGNSSSLVKAGTTLAVFVPKSDSPAVELYVGGNDIPLIYVGRKVRLEFEGFPALQFSGWPNFGFGTFSGEVASVDSTSSPGGKFRIMVVPDKNAIWPDDTFLRRGAKVKGWVLMNTVTLGYELWRQFNGFPLTPDEEALDSIDEK